MFRTISDTIHDDRDYPSRRRKINILARVLELTFYDELQYSFHTERNDSTGEYIPLRLRRPSVKYGLCRTVVDDAVGLLFSEGHFPGIKTGNETETDTIKSIIKSVNLNEVLIDAATVGSVGSVAIKLSIIEGSLFLKAHCTEYLTPTFSPKSPKELILLAEQYKVKGHELKEAGYAIADDDLNTKFWMRREWDLNNETWFNPVKVGETLNFSKDKKRSVNHALGFVPWVWVRNLPGGDDVDGRCTFIDAIDTGIEIDYLLSQGGRGLKYASDPTLLIKEPAVGAGGELVRGGGNAIVVEANGDAKMLEINGTASQAVIEYVKFLRELAIESIHGNRMGADKISAAQSGRALEIINQPLINLADKLRISYGEGALVTIIKMIISASQKYEIIVDGAKIKNLTSKTVTLIWPSWYAPSPDESMSKATAINTAVTGGFLSTEAAATAIAADYDIEDIPAELVKISADKQQRIKDQPQPKVII